MSTALLRHLHQFLVPERRACPAATGQLRQFFLLVAWFCLLSVPALAQGTSASVTGVITDPTGALLPGVTVTAFNTDTTLKQTAVTSTSGLYSIAPLPPGHYRFTASGQWL